MGILIVDKLKYEQGHFFRMAAKFGVPKPKEWLPPELDASVAGHTAAVSVLTVGRMDFMVLQRF